LSFLNIHFGGFGQKYPISVDLEKNDIKVILAVIYENDVSKAYSFKDTLSHPLPASETAMVC
jgi:hypothetical protein